MNANKKRYAVIQIWRKGAGFGLGKDMKPFDDTYEKVNWFQTKSDALKWFYREPQGQTKADGEMNRVLVKIVESLA
jgi:hypothetical protein